MNQMNLSVARTFYISNMKNFRLAKHPTGIYLLKINNISTRTRCFLSLLLFPEALVQF